jgi:myosin-1
MNIVKGQGVPDFVLLDELTENATYENLKIRFNQDQIYTYIGDVVVSVNPYKNVPIYTDQFINEYRGKYKYERAPHIYALANDAYRFLLQNLVNQTVIISGESGAGKTVSTKIIMDYISKVSTGSSEVDHIKTKLLSSNPLLEAFGNAKTLRNDNSSRFGKYMEILFEPNGAPIGGYITNYLLEKSRVVQCGAGERSFHIFYQVLAGLADDQLKSLFLTRDPTSYYYLKRSGCSKVDTIDDVKDFRAVQLALKTLTFPDNTVQEMWRVLAAILHLGNVNFAESQGVETGQVSCQISNPDEIEVIANLLNCDRTTLSRALTSRSISTGVSRRKSVISVPLDVNGAVYSRDALAKALYDKLFNFIVNHINSVFQVEKPEEKLSIGLLDIYGFEIFESNSFEQFCINLCNEKLQQVFIELTLKSEQEEYVREGIEWTPVKYFNNNIICELIEKKPMGIISLLDETCLLSESNDQTFLDKLDNYFKTHAHYQSYQTVKDRSIPLNSFRLLHYAGEVTYNIAGFVDKNKDMLFQDLIVAMQTSSLGLLKSLFPMSSTQAENKKRPETAGSQFRTALSGLIQKLLKCNPHYVRCIKPNDEKRAGFLDEQRTRHQIRYLGLVENVRVRRAGFANRQTYERFFNRYRIILPETYPIFKNTPKHGTEIIIKALGIPSEEVRFGKTKVFLKSPKTLFSLEEKRANEMPKVVITMQKTIRAYMERSKWQQRKAAIKIVLFIRKHRARRYVTELNTAFSNVRTDPTWGKNAVWPKAPPALRHAEELVKKVHKNWRAEKLILSLEEKQQALMRQKVLAYDIFKGKKPWDLGRRFEGDYLETEANPHLKDYVKAMQKIFQVYQDQRIMFADYVGKVNKNSKQQKRGIVMTERNIYKHDPKKFKLRKVAVPIAQVTDVCMSTKKDWFVVIHMEEPERDLLFDVGITGQEKCSEFVSALAAVYKNLTEKTLPIYFTDHINYNNNVKKKKGQTPVSHYTLDFQVSKEVNETTFKKGKGNNNVILVPESMQ